MDDRQKRRVHLSEIGIKSTTEKIGTVFSPFHSLELSVSQQLVAYQLLWTSKKIVQCLQPAHLRISIIFSIFGVNSGKSDTCPYKMYYKQSTLFQYFQWTDKSVQLEALISLRLDLVSVAQVSLCMCVYFIGGMLLWQCRLDYFHFNSL